MWEKVLCVNRIVCIIYNVGETFRNKACENCLNV